MKKRGSRVGRGNSFRFSRERRVLTPRGRPRLVVYPSFCRDRLSSSSSKPNTVSARSRTGVGLPVESGWRRLSHRPRGSVPRVAPGIWLERCFLLRTFPETPRTTLGPEVLGLWNSPRLHNPLKHCYDSLD